MFSLTLQLLYCIEGIFGHEVSVDVWEQRYPRSGWWLGSKLIFPCKDSATERTVGCVTQAPLAAERQDFNQVTVLKQTEAILDTFVTRQAQPVGFIQRLPKLFSADIAGTDSPHQLALDESGKGFQGFSDRCCLVGGMRQEEVDAIQIQSLQRERKLTQYVIRCKIRWQAIG